ncbi:MAG: polysaccharide biosynthesis C-terminal domain-containing protein [Vicinamibacterales bacterium]
MHARPDLDVSALQTASPFLPVRRWTAIRSLTRILYLAANLPTVAAPSFRVVVQQTLLGFGWTGVALLLGFAMKVLLTRKMPAAALGAVLTAQAFASLVLVVAELGLPDAVVRYVGLEASPHMAPRRPVHAAMKIVTVSAVLTSWVVLAALFSWSGSWMSSDALWATAILTCGLPFFAVGDVLGAAYRGVNRLGTKLFMIDVARPGIVAIALLVSPLVLARRAPYVAGLYVAGALVVLAIQWVAFGRDQRWREIGVSTPSELLRFGVPVAGAAILAGPLVNGLLPAMLFAWTGSTAVAFYAVALALQGVAGLPLGILEQVLVPVWARMAAHGVPGDLARSYRQYTNFCFASAAGLVIVMIANARAILSFLFGSDYAAVGSALQYALLATLFAAWAGPNEAMLRAVGLSRSILAARLITAAAGTTSAALLIPRYGLTGAVTSFALAVVVLNLAYGLALYRARAIHPFTPRHGISTMIAFAAVLAATALRIEYPVGGWVTAHALAVLVVAANPDVRSAFRTFRDTTVAPQ